MRRHVSLIAAALVLGAMGETPTDYTPTGLTACDALARLPIAEIVGTVPAGYADPADMAAPEEAPNTLSFCAATDAEGLQIVTLLLREATGGAPIEDVAAHVATSIDETLSVFSEDPSSVPRVDLGDGGYYAEAIGQLGLYMRGGKVLAIVSGETDRDGLEALAAALVETMGQAGR